MRFLERKSMIRRDIDPSLPRINCIGKPAVSVGGGGDESCERIGSWYFCCAGGIC